MARVMPFHKSDGAHISMGLSKKKTRVARFHLFHLSCTDHEKVSDMNVAVNLQRPVVRDPASSIQSI